MYKRQVYTHVDEAADAAACDAAWDALWARFMPGVEWAGFCLLYTSDAADERSSVDLGGRRFIKKKHKRHL